MEVIHFNQRQLAARWDISEATLERWRSEGIGPKFLKLWGRILYGRSTSKRSRSRARRRRPGPLPLPAEVRAYIVEREQRIVELEQRIEVLEEQFRLAQLKRFAPSSGLRACKREAAAAAASRLAETLPAPGVPPVLFRRSESIKKIPSYGWHLF